MTPPDHVLDLFAVPDDVEPLPGARTTSVRAGDLVLTPGRDLGVDAWLSPLLARLAVGLDSDPRRSPRDLRVAVPVPARDGSWVVEGWGASRFEPGTTPCRDLAVTLAAGRVLHARLAAAVPMRPAELDAHEEPAPALECLAAQLDGSWLGADQLVHAELAGNVLLDPHGAPVVVAVRPAWRPARWAASWPIWPGARR